MQNGGLTHEKYGHYFYPRVVEVACPICNSMVEAINVDAPKEEVYFMDLAPFKRVWKFNCINCIKRKEIVWDEMKDYELWNFINIRNAKLWAWNKDHLDFILKFLKKEETQNHKWAFFKNYLNKNWLKTITKDTDFKKIEKLLSRRDEN